MGIVGEQSSYAEQIARRRAWALILHVVVPLGAATFTYLLWRPESLGIAPLNESGAHPTLRPPACFLNHFADGVWAYTVVAFVKIMWAEVSPERTARWDVAAVALVIAVELFQLLPSVPGTFDAADVGVSLFSVCLAHLCLRNVKRIKERRCPR